MRRLSIQWACAVVAVAVCAGAAKGQVTGLNGPNPMPTGEVGVPYPGATFTALEGGAGTCCTWMLSGAPAGWTITGTNPAVVTGPATTAGFYNVTVTANDGSSTSATFPTSLTILAAPTITPTSLPAGQVGVPYTSPALGGTGGTPPYMPLSGPASPAPGLTFNPSTDVISGTPTQAGTFPFTITITDFVGGSSNSEFLDYHCTASARRHHLLVARRRGQRPLRWRDLGRHWRNATL